MEDSCAGWKRLVDKPHCDRIEGTLIDEWWHSDEASREDNANKRSIKIDCGVDPVTGEQRYVVHWFRSQLSSDKGSLGMFHKSGALRLNVFHAGWSRSDRSFPADHCKRLLEQIETRRAASTRKPRPVAKYTRLLLKEAFRTRDFSKLKSISINLTVEEMEAAKTEIESSALEYGPFEAAMVSKRRAELRQIIRISLKTLLKYRCRCIKKKKPGECDCELCTVISVNSFLWSKVRPSWWVQNKRCVVCLSATCRGACIPGCDVADPFRLASRSQEDIERHALCPSVPLRELEIDGHVPMMHRPKCVSGECEDCPMKAWPVDNRVDNSDARAVWKNWEPRWAYNDKETGAPVYKPQFVDVIGTRREFTEFMLDKIHEWLPHRWRVRFQYMAKKRFDTKRPPTAVTKMEDFAAQLEVTREANETCGVKEKHNECVSVVGHHSYNATIEKRKWGKRAASSETVRKQHVDVWYGFSPVGEKPATRYHITMQADIGNFLKTGEVLHGEVFYRGKRLPGGDHSRPLPEGIGEWSKDDPDIDVLKRHIIEGYDFQLEITDGCSGQYDGHANHHQTATWRTKTGITKQHVKNVKAHGKCACDGGSNVPKAAVKTAVVDPEVILRSGTRELVLFLATSRQAPEIPGSAKHGWWTFDCYFWAYYDPSVFSKVDVPEAKPLTDSRKLHDHIGLNPSDRDGSVGSLYARWSFCACDSCLKLNFEACLVLLGFCFEAAETWRGRRATRADGVLPGASENTGNGA